VTAPSDRAFEGFSVLRNALFWAIFGATAHLLLGDSPGPTPAPASLQNKTALILHSYYKGYRWTDDENRGIDSVLSPALGAANIYIEYMDTKRFSGRDSLEQLSEVYRQRLASHHFDVIVATDNNAFDFLRQYRDRLFPGTPVVFCGVSYFQADDLKGHRLFTGVSEEADVKDTLDLALRLHPETDHVYVVNEVTETGQTVHDEIVKLMPSYAGSVDFTFLENYSMPELLDTLRKLPPQSLVFYSFFSRDRTGRFFEYDQSAAAIAGASAAPVYGAWDFNLGFGIVGGKLISGFYQGETAGKIALRVLRGESPDSIPVVRFSPDRPNRYIFDYAQLQRWGIHSSALPKGSQIVNQPESFFLRHRTASLMAMGLSLFLIVVNTILVLNVRRRRAAEMALWEHQQHLEELVTSRSAQLEDLNSRLRLDILKRQRIEKALRESQQLLRKTFASLRDALFIITSESRLIVDCNPAAIKLFGYSRDELVGKSVRLLHVDDAACAHFGELAVPAIREKGYLHIPAFHMKRKNGEVFPTQHSVMPLYDEEGLMIRWVSVMRDITEETRTGGKLEQYRGKLRKLAAELTVVEARERKAIAAQLHENLGQLLATVKMKLGPLRSVAPDSPLQARVAEVQGLVEEALQQTRSLTYQLSPPVLYQLGLEAALKWLAENMERQYAYRVVFTRQGESGALQEESRVFLFSAVRELLVNVAKHACATQVAVRLRWLDDCVDILVKDNGKGFPRPRLNADSDFAFGTAHAQDGFGLFNIQERVSDLGGRMGLRSQPNSGTAVKIRLPLDIPARNTEIEYEHQNSAGR
jgi:PAS domain S-box-containing protein